ncbi:MAG: hypothetical protein Q9218_001567 [Villophora microphyllina]
MNVRSYRVALTPSHGYICLACRLQLPYADRQFRRQQHADARPSSSRPDEPFDSVVKTRVEDSKKRSQSSTAFNETGNESASRNISSQTPSKYKVFHPSSFQVVRTTSTSIAKPSKLDLKSSRKPSAEAEELQRRLHEKFIAQRRKDVLSTQTPAKNTGRGKPVEKTKAEKVTKNRQARRQKHREANLRGVKRVAEVTQLKTAESVEPGKPGKDPTQTTLLTGSSTGDKTENHADIAPSKAQKLYRLLTTLLGGSSTGDKTENHADLAPSKGHDIHKSSRGHGAFGQESQGVASKDSAIANQAEGPLLGLNAALKAGESTEEGSTSSTSPTAKDIRKAKKAAKAKEAADTGPATLKVKTEKKVPASLDAVIQRIASRDHSVSKGKTATAKNRKLQSKKLEAANIKNLDASQLKITAIDMEQPPVPPLSYGLERVLFNPGVYHLQDPRSRVYNFDPYLQSIMPVAEFDFNALKEYITSSRDTTLKEIANSHNKRYVGSSSSMTGILAHFHYLLSQWRDININMLSREFPENNSRRFTEIQRCPSAVFLRWNDGSYAIDADKEFAGASVLMSLGKSMEKLLTLRTDDFEKYRKSNPAKIPAEEKNAPESYHYSTMGDFLMRSQLDAHDPRLPGTGMFDLKTRAVVSVRMDSLNYEEGKGYQIRSRQGEWESFEREYFDMIRAAFLKYSLQVRMGRMDGIFVAFHNTDRIFGFQYISLAEMDSTLHGQWDTSLGDQEFKLSLSLLNDVLNKATAKYPNTSLRLHFETRETQTPFMYIFAEPVTEEQITAIQTANDAKIEEFENQIYGNRIESSDSDVEDQGWENLQANVRNSMDEDILDPNHEDDREDLKPVLNEPGRQLDGEEFASKDQPSAEVSDDAKAMAFNNNDDANNDLDEGEEGGSEDKENKEDEDEGETDADDEVEDEDKETALDGSTAEVAGDQNLHSQAATSEQAGPQAAEQPSSEAETLLKTLADDAIDRNYEHPTSTDKDVNAQDLVDQLARTDTEKSKTAMEDAGVTNSDEFATNADISYIEGITETADAKPDGKEVLAMILTVRNKVNGNYVLRPNDLGPKDKWSVEYSLDEASSSDRAWRLYQACQARRRKKLDDNSQDDQVNEYMNGYIEKLREMSRQGARWRKMQDEKDKALPVRVLGQAYEPEKELDLVENVTDPNSTVSKDNWLNHWPSYFTDQTKPKCQPQDVQVNSNFLTNNSALTYTLAGVWSASDRPVHGVSPALTYLNNPIQNCQIPSIRIDFESEDRSVAQYAWNQWGESLIVYAPLCLKMKDLISRKASITCEIHGVDGITFINLTSGYDLIPPSAAGSPTGKNESTQVGLFEFIGRDADTKACLWWGESLLSHYWSYVSWQMQIIRGETTNNLRKGFIHFSQPNPSSPIQDISDLGFWNIDYRFIINTVVADEDQEDARYGRSGVTVIYPGTLFYIPTVLDLAINNASPNIIWLPSDSLAKSFYLTIMLDLGQSAATPNILLNTTALQYFTKDFVEMHGKVANVVPGPANNSFEALKDQTSPLNSSAAVIATKYLCQVPRRKTAGSLIVSVLIANLIFLQALCKIFQWGSRLWLERRDATGILPPLKNATEELTLVIDSQPLLRLSGTDHYYSDQPSRFYRR